MASAAISRPLSGLVHRFEVIGHFNPVILSRDDVPRVIPEGTKLEMHKDHPVAKFGIRFGAIRDLTDPTNTALAMSRRAELADRKRKKIQIENDIELLKGEMTAEENEQAALEKPKQPVARA